MEAPNYQLGAHFEALDKGVLVEALKSHINSLEVQCLVYLNGLKSSIDVSVCHSNSCTLPLHGFGNSPSNARRTPCHQSNPSGQHSD